MEGEDVGLVPMPRPIGVDTCLLEGRAIHAIGRAAGFDLGSEVGHALQNARGLINVIAYRFQLRRPAQDEKGVHSCAEGTSWLAGGTSEMRPHVLGLAGRCIELELMALSCAMVGLAFLPAHGMGTRRQEC